MTDDSYTEYLLAQALTNGYSLVRDHLRLRTRDPFAVVERELQNRAQSAATVAQLMSVETSFLDRPPSDLTVELLMAFQDFVENVDPNSPYSRNHQLEMRAAMWERRYQDLSEEY